MAMQPLAFHPTLTLCNAVIRTDSRRGGLEIVIELLIPVRSVSRGHSSWGLRLLTSFLRVPAELFGVSGRVGTMVVPLD